MSPPWMRARDALELLDKGDVDAALRLLGTLVSDAPDYPTGHKLLGIAYLESGADERALGPLSRAVELAPSDEVALRSLAELHWHLGDRSRAEQLCEQLHRLRPLDHSVLDLLDEVRGEAPPNPRLEDVSSAEAENWIARGAQAVEQFLGPTPVLPEGSLPPPPLLEAAPDPEPPPEPLPVSRPEPRRTEHNLEEELAARASPVIETLTIADIYVEQGLYDQAMRIYRKHGELKPDDPIVRRRIEQLEQKIIDAGAEVQTEGPPQDPARGD